MLIVDKKAMCENCFDRPIYKFETYKDFEDFESIVQNKCIAGKLEIIDRHNDNHPLAGLDPYLFYKCRICDTIWVLSIPENAWRGYFLTQDKAIEYENERKRKEKKGQIGCLIFLLTLTAIVIWLLLT